VAGPDSAREVKMAEVKISTAANTYGSDYLPEFRRIVETYAPAGRRFLEWGSGHTTLELVRILERRGGCDLFVTIDDHKAYLDALLTRLPGVPAWLMPILESRDGPMKSQSDPEPAYSTRPLMFGAPFDFIFVDGRRRMECVLTASLLATERTALVLHDYRRGRYQLAKVLFDVVEDSRQFRVMRIRKDLHRILADRSDAIIAELMALNPALAPRLAAAPLQDVSAVRPARVGSR
jgi:hypothetical protein